MSRGRLFVISGPSGVGKTSVTRRLLQLRPELSFSVSCTTRQPRAGEVAGRDYRFVSASDFDRLVQEGAFLEWAEVFAERYGTLAGPLHGELERGRDVILDIDVRGAATVRKRAPAAILVFLVPPSRAELERRLRSRSTERDLDLRRRLERAGCEMSQAGWFDKVVVNDALEEAAAELAAIIETGPARD